MNSPDSSQRQQVIEAVVAAVPAIKRLWYREGCQAYSATCGLKGTDGKFVCPHCQQWNGQDREETVLRDITLADVLIAMQEYSDPLDSDDGVTSRLTNFYYIWDLTKNLSDQPSPVWELLHSLLCS